MSLPAPSLSQSKITPKITGCLRAMSLIIGLCCATFSMTQQPAHGSMQKQSAEERKGQEMLSVDINSASAKELAKSLKGVGAKKAMRIVEFREKFGSFPDVEALALVNGIGEKIVKRNLNRLVALPNDALNK